MSKQLLNLILLLVLVTGCKLSAFNQQAETNAKAAAPAAENRAAAAEKYAAPDEPPPTPAPSVRKAANAVCPDPAKPCHHPEKRFDEWELSFKMPARLKANTPYKSAPFYAVILKTYPLDEECDGGEFIEAAERDRKAEQANQLERKVFASYNCPNMAAVQYEFEGRYDASRENLKTGNFIAVYVGETRAEAEEALRFMKSEYPQAELKQMTAGYETIMQ